MDWRELHAVWFPPVLDLMNHEQLEAWLADMDDLGSLALRGKIDEAKSAEL